MRALVLAGVLLGGSVAHAEPTDTAAKDPTVATALSIGATLIPAVAGIALDNRHDATSATLVISGVMLGPSVGHWYAGKVFTRGAAMRLLGAGIIGVGFLAAKKYPENDGDFIDDRGLGIAIGGTVVIVLGALVDWGTAGESARKRNERITPTVTAIKTPTGSTPALGLAGSF
jgi:hypothetical protein